MGIFDAASGVITDVDRGIPTLPPQLIPGANALSYVRVDLATRRTSTIGPTLVGRTTHAWIAGHQAIVMAKGNVLYARTPDETTWRAVASFDNPELRDLSAYAVSPKGDKLVLTSPRRLSLASVLRDSLEAGRSGPEVVAMATSMRTSGAFASLDVTENSLVGVGNDRLQKKRPVDAVALQSFATTLFPQSFRAFEALGDAQQATGDRPRAQASYRKALEVNPRSTDGQRAAAAGVERKLAGRS